MYVLFIPYLGLIYSLRNTIDSIGDPTDKFYAQEASDNCMIAIILMTVKILFDFDAIYIAHK